MDAAFNNGMKCLLLSEVKNTSTKSTACNSYPNTDCEPECLNVKLMNRLKKLLYVINNRINNVDNVQRTSKTRTKLY